MIWNQRQKIRRILPSKYEIKDFYFSHWRVIYSTCAFLRCRLITYWPARSMLTRISCPRAQCSRALNAHALNAHAHFMPARSMLTRISCASPISKKLETRIARQFFTETGLAYRLTLLGPAAAKRQPSGAGGAPEMGHNVRQDRPRPGKAQLMKLIATALTDDIRLPFSLKNKA